MDPLIAVTVPLIVGIFNFIATKTYNFFTRSSKTFFWKETNDLKLFKSQIEFNELKKRVRIVVIDDEESFPLQLFKAEGYAVDKWNSLTDYGKLESGFYDIIVLDIKGVVPEGFSDDEGLGVLESLKKNNPAQIIIAFSQYSYDLSKARFWELADEKIAKPSNFLKMKAIIDNLINTKFKPNRYIDTLHQMLEKNNVEQKEIKKLDAEIIKLIQKKEQPNWNVLLKFINDKTELISQIITIGNTLIKFFN